MKHHYFVTLPCIDSQHYREHVADAALDVAEQIAAYLTPEQREALARTALTIAVREHFVNRLPRLKCSAEYGRGVHAVCTKCLQAAGLDLDALIHISH